MVVPTPQTDDPQAGVAQQEAALGESISSSVLTTKKNAEGVLDPAIQQALEEFQKLKSEVAQVEKLKQEVADFKKDSVVMLGIFASFITFLSVEVQVLKDIHSSWLLVGLSTFMLAAVLLFAITLSNLAKERTGLKSFLTPEFIIVCILLLASGGILSRIL